MWLESEMSFGGGCAIWCTEEVCAQTKKFWELQWSLWFWNNVFNQVNESVKSSMWFCEAASQWLHIWSKAIIVKGQRKVGGQTKARNVHVSKPKCEFVATQLSVEQPWLPALLVFAPDVLNSGLPRLRRLFPFLLDSSLKSDPADLVSINWEVLLKYEWKMLRGSYSVRRMKHEEGRFQFLI